MFKKVSLALIINVSGMAVGFALHTLLGRYFNPAGYGLITLFGAWTGLLRVPLLLGLDKALLKNISVQLTHGAYGAISRTVLTGLLALAINLIVIATVFYFIFAYVPQISAFLRNYWGIILAATCASALMYFTTELLRAFGSVGLSLLPQRILRPLLMIVVFVTIVGVMGRSPTPQEYFYWTLYVLGGLVIIMWCIAAWQWRRFCVRPAKEGNKEIAPPTYWSLMKLATPLSVATAMYIVYTQTDVILIGVMCLPADVGVYGIAMKVSRLALLPLGAMNFYLGPLVASLHANGNHDDLQLMVDRACVMVSIPAIAAGVGASVLAVPIMNFFGPQYTVGWPVLVILCMSQIINAVAGPAGNLLNMTGHERIPVAVFAATVILNVVLNVVGIYQFGITGAALATAFSMLFLNGGLVYMVHRRLNISMLRWWRDPWGAVMSL